MPQLPFSPSEYDRRISICKEVMRARGLKVMITSVPEHIYYLTGYQTAGFYALHAFLLPLEEEPVLVTPSLEETNVQYFSWVRSVRPYTFPTGDPVRTIAEVLTELQLSSAAIGIEMDTYKRFTGFLAIRDYNVLCSLLPDAKFKDCYGIIERARVIKSEEEISYIRQASRITKRAIMAGVEAVKKGDTENDVAAEVWHALVKNGSEYPTSQPYICSGPRSAQAHATYMGRRLEAGDVVFFEVGACVKRYHSPLIRCASVGRPSEKILNAYTVVRRALEKGIEAMKPGVMASEMDSIIRGEIARGGYGQYFHNESGYSFGIGFTSWGEPRVMSFREDNRKPLEVGMIFHLVPLALIPGLAGIGCSETVLVTKDGHEVISDLERDLFTR